MNPIIPWIGGKRRLARHLLPLFPVHTCYVEPFAGAAALFFAKEPCKVEVLNDINGDLVSLYRVVAHHLDEFVRQFRWALASRQMFEWAKEAPPATLTDIQRAARFFYLQHHAFGAKVEGQTFGTATTAPIGINLLRVEEQLSAAHLRLSGVNIEHVSWDDCMRRYDRAHTFFYCDPPYWQTEGYGVPFGLEQYEQLAEAMRRSKGKVLLSVNDHPEMRRVFGGFSLRTVDLAYMVGGNRGARAPKATELIVSSY